MTNGNYPAFPAREADHDMDDCGLTKREYFAALLAAAFITSGDVREKRAVAQNAVSQADYLIEALNAKGE